MFIPFWSILIILILIGVIGCYLIGRTSTLDYDFFTPLAAFGWLVLFVILSIGLALGKYIF